MSDDWQVGDLALCVHPTTWVPCGADVRAPNVGSIAETMFAPNVGSTYTVNHVEFFDRSICGGDEGGMLYLGLDGFVAYSDARLFVKTKLHAADAEDRETIALLNGKPVPVEAV